jgi:hypothetical protein
MGTPMNAKLLAILLSLFSMVGCSRDALLQKFASAEDQVTAKKYVDYLRAGQFAALEAAADPRINSPGLRGTLEQMERLIPDEDPISTKLVGAETMHGPDGTTKNLTFEYQFGDRWLLLNVATYQKDEEPLTIVGLHVYPQAQSLEEQNRFGLAGKSPAQYLILVLAILLPLITLYALILCAKTQMIGRKWPWIVFILLGVGKVAVNWATGEFQIMPLAIQLFSASALSDFYGPWELAVSLPLGAFVFLFKRRALHARQAS